MLETLINPKKAERKPWQMILIGALYAAVSLAIVNFLFLKNYVFEKHISLLIVCFTVIFSIPFFFYMIKLEEEKDSRELCEKKLIKEHSKAISALIFLFIGYVLAFAILFILLPQNITNTDFKAQIETYCLINSKFNIEQCVDNVFAGKSINSYAIEEIPKIKEGMNRVSTILSNNFYVLLFSLLLSFLFGAGAIFILVWNASVIATAIGIFTKSNIANLHLGLLRYLIHGVPEIASYFVAALAGGIISTAIIKHEFGKEKFWHIIEDSLDLIILALIILIVAALLEVFVTPVLF